MKKLSFYFLLSAFCFLQIIGFAQNNVSVSTQNEILFSSFMQLSQQQLLDTANYYYNKNSVDTALVCYSLIINSSIKYNDFEQQKRMIEAYNRSATIYLGLCDYRIAYDYYLKALLLCEKTNYHSYIFRIYNNLGNVYQRFKKFDIAKNYYVKALHSCQDSVALITILNNLGATEIGMENQDSAFYFLGNALTISREKNNKILNKIYNNIAAIYYYEMQYDSAIYYLQLSLNEANTNDNFIEAAAILGNLGELFFEINKIDSALYLIDLSNNIAEKNKLLDILAVNYLFLSKIAESKGNIKNAFEHYKQYASLKDSVSNTNIFGDINQLQRLYEVSKTNQQIEQLIIEHRIKERTIHYQKIVLFIVLSALLSVSVVLLYIFFQKRKLDKAYHKLIEKNLEIMNLKENSLKKERENGRKNTLTHNMQDALLNKILIIVENTDIICDAEFSIDKLAELVQSNRTYVSQVINDELQQSFRTFINGYRIREAQRLFSTADSAKYTIESISHRVGFKSRSAFRDTFTEIIGVSPSFYLKSMQKQSKLQMEREQLL